jgi:hypothetical protein
MRLPAARSGPSVTRRQRAGVLSRRRSRVRVPSLPSFACSASGDFSSTGIALVATPPSRQPRAPPPLAQLYPARTLSCGHTATERTPCAAHTTTSTRSFATECLTRCGGRPSMGAGVARTRSHSRQGRRYRRGAVAGTLVGPATGSRRSGFARAHAPRRWSGQGRTTSQALGTESSWQWVHPGVRTGIHVEGLGAWIAS